MHANSLGGTAAKCKRDFVTQHVRLAQGARTGRHSPSHTRSRGAYEKWCFRPLSYYHDHPELQLDEGIQAC